MAIRATGAAELRRVASVIRLVGSDGQIAKDITNEMRTGDASIRAAFQAHAMAVLPKRGGLNAWVADSRVSFRPIRGARRGGQHVSVGRNSLIGRSELEGLDAGLVIHPDNSRHHRGWFSQGVPPNSISEPIEDQGGRVLQGAVLFAAKRA